MHRRALRSVLALAVAGGALAALPPAHATNPTGPLVQVPLLGSLPVTPCTLRSGVYDNEFGIDSALGVLVEVANVTPDAPFCADPSVKAPGVRITLRSLRTLRVLARKTIPTSSPSILAGGITPLPIDEKHHRIFVPIRAGAGPISGVLVVPLTGLSGGGAAPVAKTLTLPTAVASSGSSIDLVSPDNPTGVLGDVSLDATGFFYDTATDTLDVLAAEPFNDPSATSAHGPASTDVYVYQESIATGKTAWVRPLGRCTYSFRETAFGETMALPDPIGVVHSGNHATLAAGCLYSRTPQAVIGGVGNNLPGVQGLSLGSMLTYLVPLDDHGTPAGTPSAYIGRPDVISGLVDPHSGRIFYADSTVNSTGVAASAPGPTAVVFDVAHHSYIGAPTVGSSAALGGYFALATAGNRLYAAGPGGITITDTRGTPPGEGQSFTDFNCFAQSLLTDPKTMRIFVLGHATCNDRYRGAPDVLVYQDNTTISGGVAAPPPDTFTTQVKEQPGLTSSEFNGHAEGVATRIRLVGGTGGLIQGATLGLSTVVGALGAHPPGSADFNDREVDLAKVSGVSVSNYEASAQADPVMLDGETNNNPANVKLGDQIHCSGDEVKKPSSYGASDTTTSVTCALATRSANATTTAGPIGLTLAAAGQPQSTQLPVYVGQSSTTAKVDLSPKDGTVSTTTSEVRDVVIGPVTLDSVSATSQCGAHGRTHTGRCTYTLNIQGARGVPGLPAGCTLSLPTSSSGPNACAELVAAINSVMPGQLTVSLPAAQSGADGLQGSPGGYQAIAQRDLYKHLQDSVLNDDDSVQIPGLEVLYVNDSLDQPSRLDIQLANVEAESHYGISRIAPCGALCGPPPPPVPVPPVAVHQPPPTGSVGPTVSSGPTHSGGGVVGSITRVLRRAFDGLKWLLRSPGQTLLVACILGLLAAPLALARRRRRLESLEGIA